LMDRQSAAAGVAGGLSALLSSQRLAFGTKGKGDRPLCSAIFSRFVLASGGSCAYSLPAPLCCVAVIARP
jgi:hypothetical protein